MSPAWERAWGAFPHLLDRKTARPTSTCNVCPWGITSLITDNCCTQRVPPCWASEALALPGRPFSARFSCGEFCIPLGPEAKAIQAGQGTAEAAAGVCRAAVEARCASIQEGSCIKLKQDKEKNPTTSTFPAKLKKLTGENYAFQWQAVSWKLCFELVCRSEAKASVPALAHVCDTLSSRVPAGLRSPLSSHTQNVQEGWGCQQPPQTAAWGGNHQPEHRHIPDGARTPEEHRGKRLRQL